MGSIRRLDSNADIQAFPGANFEIVGDVPAPQCSEAIIEGDNATTEDGLAPFFLIDNGKFAGFALAGKICHIITNPGGNTGDFTIDGNDDNRLQITPTAGDGGPTTYYISDGGELILTRNAQSFAEYIHAAGYAYTIKAGKLYTDMPSGLLKHACTILFDPLT